jgi:4-hydroxy-2-oxoheptanedioate aldolase
MVEEVATAELAVKSTRYPKQINDNSKLAVGGGIRGCAAPFIRGSGYGRNADYLRNCQEDLLVMVQVETSKGVEAIPEMAKINGLDAIFLGPMDLSCFIGKLGLFDDPQVKYLIERAEKAVIDSGCLLAGFRAPGRDLKEMFQSGYDFVCGSIDVGLLREAARQDAQAAEDILLSSFNNAKRSRLS